MADSAPFRDEARQRLGELIDQYGRALCDDPNRCEALLRDLCGEYKREAFVLVSALRAGVVAELIAGLEGTGRPVLNTLIQRMHEQLTMSEESCRWAVEAWAAVLERTRPAGKASVNAAAVPGPVNVPLPSAEQRQIAVAQFNRANQVITSGNFDYGIQLLMTCCKLDPANLIYRQALRRTEKAKFKNNLKGGALAKLSNTAAKAKIMTAKRSRDHLKVLEYTEEVLARNPWDTPAQLDLAEAADALGLLDVAVWTLEQARQKDGNDPGVNRALARLYEKRGNFSQAIATWDLVRKAVPADAEASQKSRDLAAHSTISRGNYESVMTGGDAKEAGSGTAASDRLARETAPILARIKAQPGNPDLYLQLANVYRRAGQLDQAVATLENGLGPCGNHFHLTTALSELALEPVRRDLEIVEEKLKGQPQDEELRHHRKRLLKEINARELELYRRKVEFFPKEASHRLELGLRLLRAGQVDEAIKELQAARSDSRMAWRALLYLGHCFKARNNWRLAQRNFEEALKSLPPREENTRKEILFQLATGLAEAGDLAAAVELGHELANLDYGYRDIGRLLDEWQAGLQEA